MKNVNVILLEDNAFEAEKVQKELEATTDVGPFRCRLAHQLSDISHLIKAQPADVFLLDLKLGSASVADGIENCRNLRRLYPDKTIVMRSSFDDPKTVLRCLKAGADDFISKTTFTGELAIRIDRALEIAAIKRSGFSGPVTHTKLAVGGFMSTLEARIPRIVHSAITTIHVRGESGTGKEKVADIFAAVVGPEQKFLRLNCAAIAENLMESELFGHRKGAFTGADKDRQGVLESANHGWVFLDEIACLSLSAQAALLRAIENQEITPVGASKPIKLNIRYITATNEDIPTLIREKKFRLDLWQRLSERIIEIPPLRERSEEIPELVNHFIRTMKGGPYKASPTLVDILGSLPWVEGNVRELRNCLRAMTELALGKELTPIALPEKYLEDADRTVGESNATPVLDPNGKILIDWKDQGGFSFEHLANKLFFQMLKICNAKERQTLRSFSRATGMSRTAVRNKLVALLDANIATESDLKSLIGFEG